MCQYVIFVSYFVFFCFDGCEVWKMNFLKIEFVVFKNQFRFFRVYFCKVFNNDMGQISKFVLLYFGVRVINVCEVNFSCMFSDDWVIMWILVSNNVVSCNSCIVIYVKYSIVRYFIVFFFMVLFVDNSKFC